MLGRGRRECPGAHWTEITHPDDREREQELINRLLAGTIDRYQIEKRYLGPSGEPVWAEIFATTIPKSDGHPTELIALVQDLRERKELEGQLLQSLKLESVGRLAGGIAHDFNNILSIVRGHLELLLEDPEIGLDAQRRLTAVSAATQRATALVANLTAFSRAHSESPDLLRLNEVVESLGTLLSELLGADVSLELWLNARHDLVRADRSQMEQVLLNLVLNACDAMPGGGHVLIRTEDVDRTGGSPGQVLLHVSDTGQGMDAGTAARIFEPFFTTKEKGASGLGLPTAHTIVTRVGGSIGVETAPGAGTAFTIRLPTVDGHERSETPGSEPPPIRPGRATVLVVDDEREIVSLIGEMLTAAGYDVLTAHHPAEARRIARESPGFELLVTDLAMPGCSGDELALELTKEH